jgi:elongation factor P
MAKACDMKKGAIVAIDGTPHMLEDLNISTPTARGGASIYRMRFRNLVTRQKVDKSCKGDEVYPDIAFERRGVQFSYENQGLYTFMDNEDYSETSLSAEELGDDRLYMTEEMEGIQTLVSDGRVLGVELPATTDLEITETGPSMKGASATARTKPATLSTGLEVQVPEYLSNGEVIRVDTRTGKFLSRA